MSEKKVKEEFIPVSAAYFHQAVFLPTGRTESNLTEAKMPGVEMCWMAGEGLLITIKNHKALVPPGNIVSVTFKK